MPHVTSCAPVVTENQDLAKGAIQLAVYSGQSSGTIQFKVGHPANVFGSVGILILLGYIYSI